MFDMNHCVVRNNDFTWMGAALFGDQWIWLFANKSCVFTCRSEVTRRWQMMIRRRRRTLHQAHTGRQWRQRRSQSAAHTSSLFMSEKIERRNDWATWCGSDSVQRQCPSSGFAFYEGSRGWIDFYYKMIWLPEGPWLPGAGISAHFWFWAPPVTVTGARWAGAESLNWALSNGTRACKRETTQ